MAILSPDTITTEILPSFNRRLRDSFFNSTALFEYLYQQVEVVNGGLSIKAQINYSDTPNADVFPGGVSQLPATFVNNATEATMSPCYYFYSIAIPDTAIILNQGDGEIIDIIAGQYELALMSLNNKFGADVYGDGTARNGAPTLMGMNAICTSGSDPAGGAYFGISRTGSSGSFLSPTGNAPWWNANVLTVNGGSQTGWKGTVNTGAVTTLSLGAMIAMVQLASVGQYRPSSIVTDMIGWGAYFNLLTQTVRQTPVAEIGNQGFSGLSFQDMLVFQDDRCPSGTMYTLNDLLKFRPWRGGFFRQLPWRQPSNALVHIKYGLVVCALTHERPNTMSKMSGITG